MITYRPPILLLCNNELEHVVTWAWSHLKSQATELLCSNYVCRLTSKKTSKPHVTGPLWKEIPGDWWVPHTKGQRCEKCFLAIMLSWSSVAFNSSPQEKMVTISQMTSSNAFSWMKSVVVGFKFHWSLSLRVTLTLISQHWFKEWLGTQQATNHYLNQCADSVHWCIYMWH